MTEDAERDPALERIVEKFLEMWRGVPGTRVAGHYQSLTDSDISRYRRGDWTRIHDQRKVVEMTHAVGEEPSPGMLKEVTERYGEEAAELGLSD